MVLEQYLTVSLSDFKQAGLFKPGKREKALFEWKRGEDYASITAVTDDTGAEGFPPLVFLSYYSDGEPVEQGLTLYWHNLYNGGGFYYFGCPVSGLACEKLYYSPEHRLFGGRVATGAPYLKNLRAAEIAAIKAAPYRWRILNREPRAVEF